MDHDEVSEEYLLNIRREKTARELDRIRNSFSFRCGQIIAKCLRFPPLLLLLPFWLFGFCFVYGLERLGRRPTHQVNSGRSIQNPKRCMVFFPTNGVGLGHFTRLFAVAKRVREQDPDVEIVFVTTMAALHLLESEGIPSYHLPGSYMFNDMTSAEWNAITEELLATVFEIHRPSVFVFDGAFPYRGMLNAIKNRTGLTNVWLRRGAFKKGGTKIPVDSIEHFHHILRPGDSVETTVEEIDFSTPVMQLNPILLAKPEDLLSREEARLRLGLPTDATAVYLQLGAGKSTILKANSTWRFDCSTSMKTCTWWWENPSSGTVSNSKENAYESFEIIRIRSCSMRLILPSWRAATIPITKRLLSPFPPCSFPISIRGWTTNLRE